MSGILTFTLNPSFDKKVYVVLSGLNIYQIQWEDVTSAGKGVNVSRALTKLKVANTASGALGLDFKEFQQKLRLEGVKHDFIHINHGNIRMNTTVVEGKKIIKRILGSGPTLTKKDVESIKIGFMRRIKNKECVVISGRNAEGALPSLYKELVVLAQNNGCKVVLDARDEALKRAIKARPWMVKPNCVEARDFLGYNVTTKSQYKKAVLDFHRLGVKIVILSLGKLGAVASNQEEVWWAKPSVVKAIDDVGCGDALIAGFCFAYQKGVSFKECISRAVAVASASALTPNPAEFKIKDYQKLYPKVTVQRL